MIKSRKELDIYIRECLSSISCLKYVKFYGGWPNEPLSSNRNILTILKLSNCFVQYDSYFCKFTYFNLDGQKISSEEMFNSLLDFEKEEMVYHLDIFTGNNYEND